MIMNVRNKGANGEREAAKWLELELRLEPGSMQRNLEQCRSGGFDLIGCPPFAFEVKRCQVLSKRDWWLQVVTGCNSEYNIPVVMYRQNNKKWKFLISAKWLGLENGYIELEVREFIAWFRRTIRLLAG